MRVYRGKPVVRVLQWKICSGRSLRAFCTEGSTVRVCGEESLLRVYRGAPLVRVYRGQAVVRVLQRRICREESLEDLER